MRPNKTFHESFDSAPWLIGCPNKDNDGCADLTGWTAVVDEQAGGIVAYFANETDAEAFRRLLNGRRTV